MEPAKKSLGQYWLTDQQALEAIVDAAEIKPTDTVLEIGPGLGHLTGLLMNQAQDVIAVEFDTKLAARLEAKFAGRNLTIRQADILKFNLGDLPTAYKVVANIPYYLTGNLLQMLAGAANPPTVMVLLVQKEVAQRITAKPGQMSVLAISLQLYYRTELGVVVPAKLFNPVPKVDSQVVILQRHAKPLFHELDTKKFFRLVKAGFSEKRKMLRSSLAGGLNISKPQADSLLSSSGIAADARAQELSLKQWYKLYQHLEG